jgi:copper chaperone NosL
MRSFLDRANIFFELPLNLKSRILILIAVAALIPAFIFPLWNMTFTSNQYTDGLVLHIYAHELQGGKTANRDDLREINSLNHYIGMRPLLESDFSEFMWLPLAFGALMLLALRAMAIGKMSNLVDVFVLFSYLGLFSLWSFYHRLYSYGHNLDPTASIKVEPFTPPLFGTKQIANFSVSSFPDIGSFALVLFALLLLVAIILSRKEGVATVKEAAQVA